MVLQKTLYFAPSLETVLLSPTIPILAVREKERREGGKEGGRERGEAIIHFHHCNVSVIPAE